MAEKDSSQAAVEIAKTSPENKSEAASVPLLPVAGLLFLSGMCGLIFQVSWFREFRLVFGASTAASSAVLAVFMGGLGIGNAVLGKRADRAKNPLAMYALLELSIALMAALSPLLIDVLHGSYISLGGQQALGFSAATGVRLAISFLVMGVPTFLMGGTLPAAVRVVTHSDDHQRRGAAVLYGINTLGAVVGAFVSTFFALEYFGTRGTLAVASLVNTCTAILAFGLSRVSFHPTNPGDEVGHLAKSKAKALPAAERASAGSVPAPMVYAVAGIVGFAFFLMELVWYRMLGPILGGSTFTFGLILVVALAGIGLGGVAYALFFQHRSVSVQGLASTCVLEGMCIGLPFALGDRIAILAARLHGDNTGQFLSEVGGWAVIASIVVLPAAFVSGVQFPLFIALLGQGEKDVGKQVGLAFTWNTVGAICGSLAGGFGLLPLLSAPGVWRVVASLMAILGLGVLGNSWRLANRRGLAITTLGAAIVLIAMIVCSGPTAVWRHSGIGAGRSTFKTSMSPNALHNWENGVRRSVVWEADGVESSVAICDIDALSFFVNGKSDGNAIEDAGTQIMLGLIGGILHPEPRTAIVVGLGTGETAGWLAEVPSMRRVDVVELEPAVQEMARRCRAVNHDVLSHPKVRTIFNDAREVLLTTNDRYDLIACEPSNPYRSGVANLFTREFYLAGRDRLNEKGMFLQWIQAYEIDERTMRTIFATFKSVFPHVELWETQESDMVLVGSDRTPDYSTWKLRKKVAEEPFATALVNAWHTHNLEGFLAHYVGGVALVDHIIGAGFAAINTDDVNQIEYGFARTLGLKNTSVAATLHQQSFTIGDHRPNTHGGVVDWQTVVNELRWHYLLSYSEGSQPQDASKKNPASKNTVLEQYLAKDIPGMLAAWESQPHSTTCLTELTIIALAYAEAGDSKAEPLIEQIRPLQPTEADALRGILLLKQNKIPEAGARLETALQRLHQDPWPRGRIVRKMLDAAVAVAKADPQQAPQLLKAVAEPFLVHRVEESRRNNACYIAAAVDQATAARIVDSFYPRHIPWSKNFLTFREKAFADAGHPRAPQAKRDLEEYLRREGAAPTTPRKP